MTVVGYEPLQIYNSHRARRELKLGIQNAGFLDLATEFVQIIVNNNNKFFYFAASIITYNNNRATYYSFNFSVVEIDRVQ